MADASATFKPADIATSSDAASDALSRVAVVSDAASNALSKITARSATWDTKTVVLKVYNEASAIASGDGKMYFTVPAALNGMNLTSVGGHLYTAATSGVVGVQIYNVDSAIHMLSRAMEWDATEKDTATAAASSVAKIDAAADGVLTGEELRVDIDAAASGAKGLEVRLSFRTP